MTATAVQGTGDPPSLVNRVCDWSEQGSGSANGQHGTVFWATQPGGDGTVRVYISSPRRVLLDASVTLLGFNDLPSDPTFGPVQEWLDPQSTWPTCTWSDALLAAAGQRARDNGFSAAVPPSRPRPGQALSLDWIRLVLSATYHTRTFDPRDVFMARTSTMPHVGDQLLVNPGRPRTTVYEVDPLSPLIRGVFDRVSDTRDTTSASRSTSNGSKVLAFGVAALLLLGSRRR